MERNFSLTNYLKERYRNTPRPLSYVPSDSHKTARWQREFRDVLKELLGGFPERCPLNPEITDSVSEYGYVRQRLVYDSEPGMSVSAWLFIPEDVKPGEKRPAVVALHGHGMGGKDDVAGIDHGDESLRSRIESLNYDYARQFVRRGYFVLAQDHRGWGERKGELASVQPNRDPCNIAYIESMLFGLNPLMMNVWDAMRGVDYLQQREDIDPQRIGCAGLSYGGTVSLYLAALDQRIAAAVVSCYLTDYMAYGLNLHNFCGSQTATGLLRFAEIADVGCLIAPRPSMYEMGVNDTGFPIEASRNAYAHVKTAYDGLNVSDSIEVDEFDGGHMWSGKLAYPFMAKWLGGSVDADPIPATE